MKKLWCFSVILLIGGSIYLWDAAWRYDRQVHCPNPVNYKIFKSEINKGKIKTFYQNHLKDSLFRFPRRPVERIDLIKNRPILGRLTRQSLSDNQIKTLITFLNNPDNFSWHINDILYADADDILIFYDKTGKIIGKLWLCTSCQSLKLSPFAPATKFGSIKTNKVKVLKHILQTN